MLNNPFVNLGDTFNSFEDFYEVKHRELLEKFCKSLEEKLNSDNFKNENSFHVYEKLVAELRLKYISRKYLDKDMFPLNVKELQ